MNDNNMMNKDENLINMPIEEMSDEMINSYIDAIGSITPNLWDRIEIGYEEEIKKSKTIDFATAKARRGKILGACAAAVLLVAITVPTLILTRNAGSKDKDDEVEMTTSVKGDFSISDSGAIELEEPTESIESTGFSDSDSKAYSFVNPYVNPADYADNSVALKLKGYVAYDTDAKQYVFTKQDMLSVGTLVYNEDESSYDYIESTDLDLVDEAAYETLTVMPISETELLNMAVSSVGLKPEDIDITVEVVVITYLKDNGELGYEFYSVDFDF